MGAVNRPNGSALIGRIENASISWDVEVGVLAVYEHYPIRWLKGGPDSFWCFNFEFLYL